MRLAINYSPQAQALLARGAVDVDLFKVPDWDDLIAEARRHREIYVHFPLSTNAATEPDWRRVEALLETTRTRYLNVHLDLDPHTLPGTPLAGRAPADRERAAERMILAVAAVVERFGAERVIVENLIYRGHHGRLLRAAADPVVIRRVVEETGCGLLLDLSHARISAYHFAAEEPGVDLWSYLAGLPLERLRELHLTGVRYLRERLTDHLGFAPEEWTLLDEVFARIRDGAWRTPDVVAFEYGGIGPIFEWRSEPEVIAEQLPRLAALVSQTR